MPRTESERIFISRSAEETRAFGKRLAEMLRQGSVVLLFGELGSGKTTLAQGIVHGLGVDEWASSPTYTLINEYEGRLADDGARPVRIYHCDFYRLSDPSELDTLALDEVFYGDGVALVEWPEVAAEWSPKDALRVTMERTGAQERRVRIGGQPDDGGTASRLHGRKRRAGNA